jgi:hypothetical protein
VLTSSTERESLCGVSWPKIPPSAVIVALVHGESKDVFNTKRGVLTNNVANAASRGVTLSPLKEREEQADNIISLT